ncbi:MAG: carboxypeptidase regulatory-like domain-containing protein [Bacteroidia bacterium]
MKNIHVYIILTCLLTSLCSLAQNARLSGYVTDSAGKAIPEAIIILQETEMSTSSNSLGYFEFNSVPDGQYMITCFSTGRKIITKSIRLKGEDAFIKFILSDLFANLNAYEVCRQQQDFFGISKLASVHDFGIYEGKKTEVVHLKESGSNLATNNARQVFSKVTGLNIWESDGAGLQLGVGGRGLNPNRTASFNVRQNGYDISADALGYPESYYTPPTEALESIEIVRGAASLQYGTQFGGLLNFRFKKGPFNKKAEFVSRQTLGSRGFFNSFNSLGGTLENGRFNYYGFAQYKKGNGYRDNSGFEQFTGYFSGIYELSETWQLRAEYTRMHYLAQQAGGLTDKNFEENPKQSLRDRNWFLVDWNLASVQFTHRFNARTELNIRNFGLLASRKAVGNLERINVIDLGGARTVIDGNFKNVGSETRLLHRFEIGNRMQVLLAGMRIYRGQTQSAQGFGSAGSDADFRMNSEGNPDQSEYNFPNLNVALFVEQIFRIGKKLSITPGMRYEYISTASNGYYNTYTYDLAGNQVGFLRTEESGTKMRRFLLGGIGIAYKTGGEGEIYSNFSQNYRAINFSDLRVVNPNYVIDPNIHDERGYTTDLGYRVQLGQAIRTEITGFYVAYKDKIGQVLKTAGAPLYNTIRYRTNVADARNYGLESLIEWNAIRSDSAGKKTSLSIFINTAYVNARYINTDDSSIRGKLVEMVPPLIFRCGAEINFRGFGINLNYAYTAQQFSDATNAILTATAVEGIIPNYSVADATLSYTYKKYLVQLSCNNALNTAYFTRRAESYPGPGIIPSDGRALFLSVQLKL